MNDYQFLAVALVVWAALVCFTAWLDAKFPRYTYVRILLILTSVAVSLVFFAWLERVA